jgi:hypothetical protein
MSTEIIDTLYGNNLWPIQSAILEALGLSNYPVSRLKLELERDKLKVEVTAEFIGAEGETPWALDPRARP